MLKHLRFVVLALGVLMLSGCGCLLSPAHRTFKVQGEIVDDNHLPLDHCTAGLVWGEDPLSPGKVSSVFEQGHYIAAPASALSLEIDCGENYEIWRSKRFSTYQSEPIDLGVIVMRPKSLP